MAAPDERLDEEEKLVTQAKSGDAAAFEQLFFRYYMKIHAFAYRCCLDHFAAQDIAQETFIKGARVLGELRDGRHFKAWLYRIALNAAHDVRRRSQRGARLHDALIQETLVPAATSSPDHAAVAEALSALPPAWRDAVALTFYEGLSHAEAAKVLGCAETTVSWRVFRAKRKLKQQLSRQNHEG